MQQLGPWSPLATLSFFLELYISICLFQLGAQKTRQTVYGALKNTQKHHPKMPKNRVWLMLPPVQDPSKTPPQNSKLPGLSSNTAQKLSQIVDQTSNYTLPPNSKLPALSSKINLQRRFHRHSPNAKLPALSSKIDLQRRFHRHSPTQSSPL